MIKFFSIMIFLILPVVSYSNEYAEYDRAMSQQRVGEAEQILTIMFKMNAKTETAFKLGILLINSNIPKKIIKGTKLLIAAKKYGHRGASKYLQNRDELNNFLAKRMETMPSKKNEVSPGKYASRIEMAKRYKAMPSMTVEKLKQIIKTGRSKGIRADIYIDSYSPQVSQILKIKKSINKYKPLIDIKVYLKSPDWSEMTKEYVDILKVHNDVVLDIQGRYSQHQNIVSFPTVLKFQLSKPKKVTVNEILQEVISIADSSGINYK